MFDAVIIGGGPAGATAGRLLAQWGHAVVILTAPADPRPTLAECLPPSTRKLFRFLGIQDDIDGAGFYRTNGNTVWWGGRRRRVEPYPAGFGYQVPRGEFDRLLLGLAQSAGAQVRFGKVFSVPGEGGPRIEFQTAAKRVPVRARFLLDCSGRAGVIGRRFRVRQRHPRTVALWGVWRNDEGWKLPDPSHTLVESYGDGWAWSVPLARDVRHVAFMVGPGETQMVRGQGPGARYRAELAKTAAFRRIFARGALERGPWGRDASLYTARSFCGPGFLLAGDAGACIDPLSSFGVKKAMVSAWAGAVVANTWLRKPAMRETALRYFEERERQVQEDYARQSGAWFRAGAARQGHPFWEHRGEEADAANGRMEMDAVRAALEALRRKSSIHLRRADGVRTEPRPGIEGREIVLRDALMAPGVAGALDFLANVHLPRLVELAERGSSQVPDLYEAYNRACAPVALPDFLTALAALVAKGILIDRA
ncbi:MAG: tryptophan 7-halogenase [Acidobacteriia bacterium]|nr:tryptophan 7-halogenase [Terriglobia bacterium]